MAQEKRYEDMSEEELFDAYYKRFHELPLVGYQGDGTEFIEALKTGVPYDPSDYLPEGAII